MADGIRQDGDDLVQEVRDGIRHLECCAFLARGTECDCGCMEAMDALNRLVAERDCYREALDRLRSLLAQVLEAWGAVDGEDYCECGPDEQIHLPGGGSYTTEKGPFRECRYCLTRRALAAVREGR